MRLTVINYFFILILFSLTFLYSLSSAAAVSFSFSSPDEAELSVPFNVTISADSTEEKDVKVFIKDSAYENLSEIYNDGWKSTRYYIKSAFPEKDTFTLLPKAESNKAEICIRLRKIGKTAFEELCKDIVIIGTTPSSLNKEIINAERGINNSIINVREESNEKKEEIIYLNSKEEKKEEIIYLNSKEEKKEETFVTKKGKFTNYIFIAFELFLIILLVLFYLRKI